MLEMPKNSSQLSLKLAENIQILTSSLFFVRTALQLILVLKTNDSTQVRSSRVASTKSRPEDKGNVEWKHRMTETIFGAVPQTNRCYSRRVPSRNNRCFSTRFLIVS